MTSHTFESRRAYFAKTGIFPMMHAVAIRKDVIQAHPWLPRAVFRAYSQSKIQYSHEQGLAKRKLEIEELFHPSTLGVKEDLS